VFACISIYIPCCHLSSFVEGFVPWPISLCSQLCSYWKNGFITLKTIKSSTAPLSRLHVSDVSCHLLRESACTIVTSLTLPAQRGAAYWLIVTTLKLAQGYVRLFSVNMFFKLFTLQKLTIIKIKWDILWKGEFYNPKCNIYRSRLPCVTMRRSLPARLLRSRVRFQLTSSPVFVFWCVNKSLCGDLTRRS